MTPHSGLADDDGQTRFVPFSNPAAVATMAIFALLAALYWSAAGYTRVTFSEDCRSLDETASANIANMVRDTGATAQPRLAEAMFRLNRARNHCRNGWVALARRDYDTLINGRHARLE